ncbi:hypothetical protein ABW21_db0201974 [Orbilia brochopaga]|nr:hypothetical protein ABW21_db0201974 [Drechslerella brochopaga]
MWLPDVICCSSSAPEFSPMMLYEQLGSGHRNLLCWICGGVGGMKESALMVEDGESMNSGVEGDMFSDWLNEAVIESMNVLLDSRDPSTRTPFICKSDGLTSMRGGIMPANLLLLTLRDCCG